MLFHRGFAIVGRISLVVGGLVLALYATWLFGAFVGIVPLRVVDPAAIDDLLDALRGESWRGVFVAAVAASVATLGIALAVFGARGTPRVAILPLPAPEDGEPGGAVAISNASISAIGRRTADERQGVHATSSRARLRRNGWQIDLGITVASDLSVPEIVTEIRTKLAAALEHQTGLPLGDLRVRAELERPELRTKARVQ